MVDGHRICGIKRPWKVLPGLLLASTLVAGYAATAAADHTAAPNIQVETPGIRGTLIVGGAIAGHSGDDGPGSGPGGGSGDGPGGGSGGGGPGNGNGNAGNPGNGGGNSGGSGPGTGNGGHNNGGGSGGGNGGGGAGSPR